MKKIYLSLAGIMVLLVLLIVVITMPSYKEKPNSSADQEESSTVVTDMDNIVITTEVIKEKLEKIGVLETASYNCDVCLEFDKDGFLSLDITHTKYIGVYPVELRAGIDCSKILVNNQGKEITVVLPKSVFQTSSIDHENKKNYEIKQGLFNRFEWDDFDQSMVEVKDEAYKKAKENGVLQKADENARVLVENLVLRLVQDKKCTVKVVTAES